MENQIWLSRHYKFFSAENITILSVSSDDFLHAFLEIYIYIYIYIHTHTHTHIYIYIYILYIYCHTTERLFRCITTLQCD